jgi:DNA-3-methyladenine glycosylase
VSAREPGAAYVYLNYGMYWLLNVLVKGPDLERSGFVLFRAIEPIAGVDRMRERRLMKPRKTPVADHQLCAGPGRLAVALGVTGADHGHDLCSTDRNAFLAARPTEWTKPSVETDVRIGISQAKEFPWRFLLKGSPSVSVRVAIPKHPLTLGKNGA